jgi:hypothetical protein
MCDLNDNLIENISSPEIFIKIDKIISGERKIIEKIKNCDMRLVELWDGNMENFADKYL